MTVKLTPPQKTTLLDLATGPKAMYPEYKPLKALLGLGLAVMARPGRMGHPTYDLTPAGKEEAVRLTPAAS